MSVIIFLAVLFVLVLVHEFGHFIVAKWSGMRVDEFGIGFPPKLFGIKRGETEYTYNLLPIGGFVKIYGEDGSDESVIANDAYHRSFGAQSKLKQSAVLVAGVCMNILFAWFLFSIAFMMGVTRAVDESNASSEAQLVITDVRPDAPAARAGIVAGAHIMSVHADGKTLETKTPTAFSDFIGAHADSVVTLTYMVGDEMRVSTVEPQAGVIAEDPERAALGVALTLTDVVRASFFNALADATTHTWTSLGAITIGLATLVTDAVTGDADFSQVAGPIGIVGLVGEASAYGFTALLVFTAFISLNLAVINILPFPALDGGRLLFVLIETLKRSPIKARYAQILNTIGFVLLMLLMIVVAWNDIARLF